MDKLKTYERLPLPADSAWDRPTYNPITLFQRALSGTWLERKVSNWLVYPTRDFIQGVTNLVQWAPVIWRDRHWDDSYIMYVLRRKIELQREELVGANRSVCIPGKNRDMTIVLNLLVRAEEEYYSMEYMDYHESEIIWEPTHDPQLCSMDIKLLSERFDEYLAKYPSSVRAVLKSGGDISEKKHLCMLVAQHNEQKAWNLLFRVLREKMPGWWD
jgi:hypothetical protein